MLREITRTVSGQFISHNPENDMYYLDVRKDIDYDAKIEERAATLNEWRLDHYYFDALARVMKTPDATYVSGYRIWEHEIIWADRKAGRPGTSSSARRTSGRRPSRRETSHLFHPAVCSTGVRR